MHSATFLAEVHGGLIRTGQPLAEFEGKQVYVTLIALDAAPQREHNSAGTPAPAALPHVPEDAEILEDTGRIRLPPRDRASVHLALVDVGRLPMRVYSSDLED
jgi:hypothetical protein